MTGTATDIDESVLDDLDFEFEPPCEFKTCRWGRPAARFVYSWRMTPCGHTGSFLICVKCKNWWEECIRHSFKIVCLADCPSSITSDKFQYSFTPLPGPNQQGK